MIQSKILTISIFIGKRDKESLLFWGLFEQSLLQSKTGITNCEKYYVKEVKRNTFQLSDQKLTKAVDF